MNTQSLVKQFKAHFEAQEGIKLDFRKHQFLDNQHGNSHCFRYEFAELVVTALYEWAHQYIEEHEENYPHFVGWEYNLSMECEKLRSSKLSDLVNDVCHALYLNFVDTLRFEGRSVFKYSPENRAYIFDHVR